MPKKPKGHGNLEIPWWFVPLMFPVLILLDVKNWFKRRFKKGDPHDISGEPDIPGGNRP